MGRLPRVLAGAAVVAGAAAVLLPAWAIDWLACENDNTPACDRKDLAQLQHVVAWVGVVPAAALAVALVLRRRRAAWFALVAVVIAYATWAVIADAAVHGWDDLVVVPFVAGAPAPPG